MKNCDNQKDCFINCEILNHYLKFSTFTNAGPYMELLKSLPENVRDLGNLITHQIIHRVTLMQGNSRANADLRYGDMNEYPWHRLRCDDDIVPTSVAMIAELLRMDERGFVADRAVENKLIATCRYVAVLMASILKSKAIPCRVRSGFATYFGGGDHWINQYWNGKRWVTIDADGFLDSLPFDQYDIPEGQYVWAARAWAGLRQGEYKEEQFQFAGGTKGFRAVLRAVFHDFHSLMNNEIMYLHQPEYVADFASLSKSQLKDIDKLAELMLSPDENFEQLFSIWHSRKEYRILSGGLL